MKTIVNFAHPLPEGRADVVAVIGGEYRVIPIPVQVDQAAPLLPQCRALADAAIRLAGNRETIDAIVLPGLAPAAVGIYCYLLRPVLRLAPVAGATPPRFEAAEVMLG